MLIKRRIHRRNHAHVRALGMLAELGVEELSRPTQRSCHRRAVESARARQLEHLPSRQGHIARVPGIASDEAVQICRWYLALLRQPRGLPEASFRVAIDVTWQLLGVTGAEIFLPRAAEAQY